MSHSESRARPTLPPPEGNALQELTIGEDGAGNARADRPASARAQDAVLALGRRAIATPDPDVLIDDAAHLISEIAGTELALVACNKSDTRQRLVGVTHGTISPAPDVSTDGSTLAELAASRAHPIVVPDLPECNDYSDRYLARNGVRGALVVPLRLQDADFGALGACSRERVDFEVDAIYVAESIGHLVATTLAHYRSESLLQQSRRHTETLCDTIDALVLVIDSSGMVQTMNRACTEVTGFTIDDFMGRPVWTVLAPPNESLAYREAIAHLTTSGSPFALEARLLTKHCEERIIAWRLAASPGAGDGSPSFMLTGIDITKQRRAEERAERAKKALAHLRSPSDDGGSQDSFSGSSQSESGRSGELASGRRLTETERRIKPRRPFPYVQNIAYITGSTYPVEGDFFKVRCRDIAAGGFSFVCPILPHGEELVVALGSPRHLTYLTARVVHVTDSVENGEAAHLVGCQYTGRAPT